jgi:hypothetical protein
MSEKEFLAGKQHGLRRLYVKELIRSHSGGAVASSSLLAGQDVLRLTAPRLPYVICQDGDVARAPGITEILPEGRNDQITTEICALN